MKPSRDEALLCAYCKKKPATTEYTLAGETEKVCATCFDRATLQDFLERRILGIIDLEKRGQYDEALACMAEILEANRYRDHDGWLARSVADHRALTLYQAGRYAEAEQAHLAWAQLGFADFSERCVHASGTAQTLSALGRDSEAIAVIEDALGYEAPDHLLLAAQGTLNELARISEKLGQPVNAKWRKLAESIAERYGVDMPSNDSLGKAILALFEITRSMTPKRDREDATSAEQ